MPGQHFAAGHAGDHLLQHGAHQVQEAAGIAQGHRPVAGGGQRLGDWMVVERGQLRGVRAAQAIDEGGPAAVRIDGVIADGSGAESGGPLHDNDSLSEQFGEVAGVMRGQQRGDAARSTADDGEVEGLVWKPCIIQT